MFIADPTPQPETKGYTIEELSEVFDGEKESHIAGVGEREKSDIEVGDFEKKSDIEHRENAGIDR